MRCDQAMQAGLAPLAEAVLDRVDGSRRRMELIMAYRSMVWPHFDFMLITDARVGRETAVGELKQIL
jgi:hypothetical protein